MLGRQGVRVGVEVGVVHEQPHVSLHQQVLALRRHRAKGEHAAAHQTRDHEHRAARQRRAATVSLSTWSATRIMSRRSSPVPEPILVKQSTGANAFRTVCWAGMSACMAACQTQALVEPSMHMLRLKTSVFDRCCGRATYIRVYSRCHTK